MTIVRRILRYLGITIVSLLLLFLLMWILLQYPRIQTYVVGKITHSLEENLNTRVSIEYVDINFFSTLELQGIYIEDQSQDTLLYTDVLSADIRLFSLWKKTLSVKNLTIQGGILNLKKSESGEFNINFLLKAFETDKGKVSTDKAPWQLDLSQMTFANTAVTIDDQLNKSNLRSKIGQLNIDIEQLDFENNLVRLHQLDLLGSSIFYTIQKNETPRPSEPSLTENEITFPFTGWNINCGQIKLSDNTLSLHNYNYPDLTQKHFNANHLDYDLTKIQLEDFRWNELSLTASLAGTKISQQNEQFEIERLSSNLSFTNKELRLKDLMVKTSSTQIDGDIKLAYSELKDLYGLNRNVTLDGRFEPSLISEKDLNYLSSTISKFVVVKKNKRNEFSGNIYGTLAKLDINQFKISLDNRFSLLTSGTVKNLDDIKRLTGAISLSVNTGTAEELNSLFPQFQIPKELGPLGKVRLRAKIKGSLNALKATDIILTSTTETYFKGSAEISGINSKKLLAINLQIDSLKSNIEEWQDYYKNAEAINNLGELTYKGMLQSQGSTYTLDGLATTAVGKLKADLSVEFKDAYTDADYSGELYLMDFDLSKITSDSSQLGLSTVYFIGKGSGLRLNDVDAKMEAIVESLEYNKYNYEYLNIEGNIKNRKFEGQALFEDDNMDLVFAGLINFEDSVPVFDFKSRIDTLDLQKLNFVDYQLNLRTDADINFRGTSLANIEGSIVLTDLIISDSTFQHTEDSLQLLAQTFADSSKVLDINSKFLDAIVKGDFDIDLLSTVLGSLVDEFFPIPESLLSPGQIERIADQAFTFDIQLIDGGPIRYLGLDESEIIKSGYLQGDVNYASKRFNLNGQLIEPSYTGISTDTLDITARGTKRRISSKMVAYNFRGAGLSIANLELGADLVPDSLLLNINAYDENKRQLALFSGIGTGTGSEYQFSFDEEVVLNDTSWAINNDNIFYISKGDLFVDKFTLYQGNSQLDVQSEGDRLSALNSDINISFIDFEFANLLNLAMQDNGRISGLINGVLNIKDPMTQPALLADMVVDDLYLDEQELGNLSFVAGQSAKSSKINLDVDLDKDRNRFSASGTYDTQNSALNIEGVMNAFELVALEPFTTGSFGSLTGTASGNFKLTGTPEQPEINTKIKLKDASTVVAFLNVKLLIPESEISINPTVFDLGNINVRGEDGRTALLSGIINHDRLQDFDMNLIFETDDFQLLNSTQQQNELFWGTLNLDATVKIKGGFNSPKISVDARTLPKSVFNFQVNTIENAITNADYIVFANPNKLDATELAAIVEQAALSSNLKLDMTINLVATPEAELTIILNPLTGDKIVGKGNGTMVINLQPDGDIKMLGAYNIQEGKYEFNYGQFIKKSFDLEPSSKVTFSGDPLNAEMDIVASYSSNSSLLDLVKNETTLSDQESRNLQKRTTVKTLLYLQGALTSPDISFDIQIPRNNDNALTSAVNRKLLELRGNENEMHKQVFSLLLFNTFFPTTNAGNVLVGQGENIALTSVSKLITNQLNNLSEKYIKGVDINIDLESYQSQIDDNQAILSELQVGLSKTLFNDRLVISAGADIDLASQKNTVFSNVVGDFLLEYRLSESGNYILKVFRKNDFDILKDENTARNGIGVSIKRSFGKPSKKSN